MFGLPDRTYFGKLIPKNKFYNNLSIDRKLERSFIDQIVSIRWLHKLSTETLNVSKGSTVEEVEVFLIKLKNSTLDINVLQQIDRQLHYHLIFILEFEERYQLWTCFKEKTTNNTFKVDNYYHTTWVKEENFSLTIDGLNLDTIYESLVRQIAGKKLTKENNESLKETVERQMATEKREKEIEKLRTKIRNEKQFNRQVELNEQLKNLLKQAKV